MATFTIQLHNLRFFAAHGMFEEERAAGNEFEVNIALTIKAPKKKVKSLEHTINYAEVYRIAKEIFSERSQLLETLGMEIGEVLKAQFPSINQLSVDIKKLNPPIIGFTGSVGVRYEKTYK